jgi:monothiol glutaredoxin
MDLGTAQRANGINIETIETPQGVAFRIDNPNSPHQVRAMTVRELQALMGSGDGFHLFDVRTPAERETAMIKDSHLLDQDRIEIIVQLPEDATLVFYCHTGSRSQAAAEHFAAQGFTQVYNVVGGIDAWSKEIDPDVPTY